MTDQSQGEWATGETDDAGGHADADGDAAGSPPTLARRARRLQSDKPNTGSRLRDHLANERTFLAWTRTGVALITLGIAIDKLLLVKDDTGRDLGWIVVAGGLFCIVYATYIYTSIMYRIERDIYQPNLVGPLILAATLTVGGVLAFAWVVTA